MKAIDVLWFNDSTGCIGLVAAENSNKEIVFLLGSATGHDEEEDSQHIADWGAKVSPESVIRFFVSAYKQREGEG